MQLLKHFNEISLHPKNAKELKGIILQLAVQGKLTTQWRNENQNVEHASVLADKIRIFNSKQLLLKSRRIKKQEKVKKRDLILPKNWAQVRNFELFSLQKGKNPKDLSETVKKYSYQDIEALDRGNIRRYSNDEKAPKCTDSDILVVCDGSRSGLVLEGRVGIVGSTLAIIETPLFLQPFVKLLFLEGFERVNSNMKGAAIPHLDTKNLLIEAIGLPPLEEQKAIVKTVEQLFKEVEQLEALTVDRIQLKEKFATSALNQLTINNTVKEWKYLKPHFHTFFNEEPNIKKLRETILQLAVQGKLTAHWRKSNPVAETAEQLLKKIKAEKEQLIKDKKIKKEKPLPPISEDEIPYELSEGWVWCRFDEVSYKIGDVDHKMPTEVPEGIPYVSPRDFGKKNIINYASAKKITINDFNSLANKIQPERNDIIFPRYGTIGVNRIVEVDIPFLASYSCAIVKNMKNFIVPYYAFYYSVSNHVSSEIDRYINKTTQPNVGIKSIKLFTFPLPPLEEQKAIVETVNSLMALCDSLEKEVKQSKAEVEDLMKGGLREVVG